MDRDRLALRRTDLVVLAGCLAVVLVGLSLVVRGRSLEVMYGLFFFHNGPSALILLLTGRLVLVRQPRNAVGAVLIGVGLISAVHTAFAAVADVGLVRAGATEPLALDHVLVPAELPLLASIPLAVMGWLWVFAAVPLVTVLPLIFPDGEVPHRIGRPVLAVAGLGSSVLAVAFAIDTWPTIDATSLETRPGVVVMIVVGGGCVLISAAAALAVMTTRGLTASGTTRKAFGVVGLAAALLLVVGVSTYPWQAVWTPAVLCGLYLLFAAYGLAAARFRLHDLDPVVGRPLVTSALRAAIDGSLLVSVAVVAILVSHRRDGLAIPLVAAVGTAVVLLPLRRIAIRAVERVILRRTADRTDVMSQVAHDAAGEVSWEATASAVAELLYWSTGALRAEVWEQTTTGLTCVAAVGDEEVLGEPIRAEIAHGGQRLGELRLLVPEPVDLAPDSALILDDVARVLAITLHSRRLSAELSLRLGELSESRRRLVQAHDLARRDLERDLHDGVQAEMVAVRIRLGVIQHKVVVGGPTDELESELAAVSRHLDAAVGSLRTLARGVHPASLDEAGLVAALRAYVVGLPEHVTLTADGLARYPSAVETALYYICLEAVQNALKHAAASTIAITLVDEQTSVVLCVEDDGCGMEAAVASTASSGVANMRDRAAVVGADVSIGARPEGGSRVRVEVPVIASRTGTSARP